MNGRILHLSLDVTITPPQEGEVGETDEAAELGAKLALEIGLLAQHLAPAGSKVEVERKIVVY